MYMYTFRQTDTLCIASLFLSLSLAAAGRRRAKEPSPGITELRSRHRQSTATLAHLYRFHCGAGVRVPHAVCAEGKRFNF